MANDIVIQRTSGFLSSEGEQIYYETTGDCQRQALVLCHGLGGNHASWYQQVPRFAQNHFVVTWDQRGFGRSSNRFGKSSPSASTRDLARLLDELRIQQAHVVGQSMGGWVALGFALEQPEPERTASLTLSDTIAGIFTPETEQEFDNVLRRQAATASAAGGELPLGVHPALGKKLQALDPAKAFLYQQLSSLGPPPPAEVPTQLRATSFALTKINRLAVPVLFIVGAEDPIFSPATIRTAAAQLPSSRVVEIPGAGHSPYFEAADLWNDALAEFLQSVSLGGRGE